MSDTAAVEAFYAERAADLEKRRDVAMHRLRQIEIGRLATFAFTAGTLLIAMLRGPDASRALWMGTAILIVAFVALVVAHSRLTTRTSLLRDRALLARTGVHRVRRDWTALPDRSPGSVPGHAYAEDLDLFGAASLAALLPPATPFPGAPAIRQWLLEPALASEARRRQSAVAELAPLVELRDELAIEASRIWDGHRRVEHFVNWAEDDASLLAQRPMVVAAARVLPVLTIALGVAHAGGVIAGPLWTVPLSLGMAMTAAWAGRLSAKLRRALPESETLARYGALLRTIATARFDAPLLREIQSGLLTEQAPAHRQIARLVAIMQAAEVRRSPMLYFALQLTTLWDFHLVHRLERWQRSTGKDVRRWLDSLGSIEALSALATLAHDNPDWTFPELSDSAPASFEARALGHPLLPPRVRVANDVTVGPPGTFLLVTGSNMAGKSTLIRAIGLNVVLAQCGGPVCAEWLRCSPLDVHSVIRVQDSLERGVSYFMAELQRLKQVVDAARAAPASGRTLLYLLDEILQGTNSAERTIAARRILRYLISAGAIGAVTTHDLALADTGSLARSRVDVHFTEQLRDGAGGSTMWFDYRLRPGVATSTNALKLLEMVGLPDDATS